MHYIKICPTFHPTQLYIQIDNKAVKYFTIYWVINKLGHFIEKHQDFTVFTQQQTKHEKV